MITPISNYVFFTADKEKENELKTSFGTLEVATFAEHGKFNRIYGEVIGVPGKLTPDINLYQKDHGFPEPKYGFSHEDIQSLTIFEPVYEEGTPEYKEQEAERKAKYVCSPAEMRVVKMNAIEQEVKIGDRVYFHYNQMREENRYKLDDGRKIYKVRYDQIICVVRQGYQLDVEVMADLKVNDPLFYAHVIDGNIEVLSHLYNKGKAERYSKIIMIGGHVLVKPVWEDQVEDLGIGDVKLPGYSALANAKGRVNKLGLVVDLHEKPKPLEGIVKHIGSPLKGEEDLGVEPGDKVIFLPESDWENTIEGEKYFVMKQRDLLAKV